MSQHVYYYYCAVCPAGLLHLPVCPTGFLDENNTDILLFRCNSDGGVTTVGKPIQYLDSLLDGDVAPPGG